jgi:hypothetical protein
MMGKKENVITRVPNRRFACTIICAASLHCKNNFASEKKL